MEAHGGQAQERFMRRISVYVPVALVVYAGAQLLTSAAESDPEIRELWLEDLTAQSVIGLLAVGVALFIGRWAARRDRRARVRGVIGLAACAVVVAPLVWWSAAPAVLAASAITLGDVTGVNDRERGSGPARTLTLLAGLAAAVAFTIVTVSVIVKAS
jgi:FtsH-binding integral membrane protein